VTPDPIRIELARLSAGLTQGELSKILGKTQPFISQVESGERTMPPELVAAWAGACGVNRSFFSKTELPLSDALAGMVHRAMKTLPAKPFRHANARVKVTALALDALFAEVEVHPALQLPELPTGSSGADAAKSLRRAWRIADGPVEDLVALIESAAIPVVFLDGFHEKQSATSHRGNWFEWMIALNAGHPSSRLRFTLAHELGHIVLQHNASVAEDELAAAELERQADAFASELLMPETAARRELRGVTFSRLVALKQRWRVSLAFLIRRAFDTESISQSQRTSFEIELSSLPGGRKREPAEFPAETPSLVRRLVNALQADGLDSDDIAALMGVTEATLRTEYLRERTSLRAVPSAPRRAQLDLTRP
jgi:Zn-dependent peptidase ImmA (M78 family)